MRSSLRYILPIILPIVAIILVVGSAAVNQSNRPDQVEPEDAGVLVDVIKPSVSPGYFVVESQGNVKARTETSLVSEVSGKVVSVSPDFVAGGFFRKGDVLLQIDPSDYLTAKKSAEANLASREAQLAQESARAEQALKDWQNLGRPGQPSDLVLRKPQLAEAQANILSAQADLQKAERDLQRTRIQVPYDGLVKSKRVDIGQFVSAGTQLGITFAVDSVEIRLPMTTEDIRFVNLPSATSGIEVQNPRVTLTTQQGGFVQTWEGTIIRTEGVIDEATRMVHAVAEVVDPYGVFGTERATPLEVGTFVHARIDGTSASGLLTIPRSILRNDDTVLTVDSDDKLAITPINIARTTPDLVFVHSGIELDTRIVTTAFEAPIPGTDLAINTTSDSGPATEESQQSPLDEVVEIMAAGNQGTEEPLDEGQDMPPPADAVAASAEGDL